MTPSQQPSFAPVLHVVYLGASTYLPHQFAHGLC